MYQFPLALFVFVPHSWYLLPWREVISYNLDTVTVYQFPLTFFTGTVPPLVVVEGVIGHANILHTQPNCFCVKYKQNYCHFLFGIYFNPKVLIQPSN